MRDLGLRLDAILSTRSSTGKLFLSLAHLEKQGHAKLLKFKRVQGITDAEFLEHLTDEARHAHQLKKDAEGLGADATVDHFTRSYLTRLEVFILRKLRAQGPRPQPRAPYVLMTYVIEKRAEALYPALEARLRKLRKPLSVEQIIQDEAQHLRSMEAELGDLRIDPALIQECRAFEARLFEKFILRI